MYAELHAKISPRSFQGRIAQSVDAIKEAILERGFLNIAAIAKGGSVGRGTAIVGGADAELVVFLRGLPHAARNWQEPLLRMMEGAFSPVLEDHAKGIHITEDSLRMSLKDDITLDIRFRQDFGGYEHAVQALGACGPLSRKFFEPCFVAERGDFIAKQPPEVKTAMRLLKWWRDQQPWSCALTRPADVLLELGVIYAAQQCPEVSVRRLVAQALLTLSRFDQLRVVWSNYYKLEDVWSPLLLQRPLLMDPVNPFSNIADPQDFDPREMIPLAATTHFFW